MDEALIYLEDDESSMEEGGMLLQSLLAGLLSVALIWPPDEFVSAGATFENIFSSYIGNPQLDIIGYQSRKVLVNRCCVASLPFIYSVFLYFNYYVPAYSAIASFQYIALLLFTGAVMYFIYNHSTDRVYMRPVQDLCQYSSNLKTLSIQLTSEFNDFNNFTASFAHSQKFVVSESWVFNITRFDFTVVNLSDVTFEAVQAVSHDINPERHDHVHFLTIQANVSNRPIKGFKFRVRTENFRDLQAKVARPIGIARDVILHQTLNERFVKAFVDYITDNPKFLYTNLAELESCFGCSAEQPNVKISIRCNRAIEGEKRCRECFCRPMWCVACMARVFASKQDQDRPELWLDGQATCPTCRAEFCVQDVSFVVANEEEL